MKGIARAVAQAQEVYYMANGTYATGFDELAIELPGGNTSHYISDSQENYMYPWGVCAISIGATEQVVFCENTQIKMRIQTYYQHSPASPGSSSCIAENSAATLNSIQNQVCKSETGKSSHSKHIEGRFTIWKY